jgi:N-acylneuraminate cytidylyltransferase
MVARRQIAIIPARGGSKRINRKNIVDFYGKPLLAWTIGAALQIGEFDRVVVSTDDPEVAEIAKEHGASVPFLRKRYADDQSPVSLATIGTLEQLREVSGEDYDVVVQLMPNCPLRDHDHIAAALEHFSSRSARSQISCFKFGWMNPWWAAKLNEDGRPTSLFPEALKMRSQDLPELFCPTGAIWIAQVPHLYEHQTFHTPERVYFPMPWQSAIDIDDHEDLLMAKALFLMRGQGQ